MNVGVGVSSFVASDLAGPIPGVLLVTDVAMLRAAVPEAPVNEYGDTGA